MSVTEIRPDNIKECLEGFLENRENLKGVIIISLNKDGTQYLSTANLTMHEKAFLKCFFDSFINKWFEEQYSLIEGR